MGKGKRQRRKRNRKSPEERRRLRKERARDYDRTKGEEYPTRMTRQGGLIPTRNSARHGVRKGTPFWERSLPGWAKEVVDSNAHS